MSDQRIQRYTLPSKEEIGAYLTPDELSVRRIHDVLDFDLDYRAKLHACNHILKGCGIESLEDNGSEAFLYINTGDTYERTLIYEVSSGQWLLASWGDVWDEYEQEHELGAYETFNSPPDRCVECHGDHLSLEHDKDRYAWECQDCNHHHFAVPGYQPGDDDENASSE